MDMNLSFLILCGYSVCFVSSQLTHLQSCSRTSSLDTECLLSFVRELTGQLATQNELQTKQISSENERLSRKLVTQKHLLANTTGHLANKTELKRIYDKLEEISRNVTIQCEILSNQTQVLLEQNQALATHTEGLETQMEEISRKVTRQNELLFNQTQELTEQNQALASKTEGLKTNMGEILRKVTSQSELLANQTQELSGLASKTESLETHMGEILRKVTSQSELLSNQKQELSGLASKTERLETHIQEIALKMISQSEHILNQTQDLTGQNQALARKIEGLDTTMELIAFQNELLVRHFFPENCIDIYSLGKITSGVYTIYEPLSISAASTKPLSIRKTISVYCDQDTNGGPGWLVIQRRQDDSVSFNRTWNEYREGFGSLSGNLWLGNQNLAMITGGDTTYELRIDLEDWSNEQRYVSYSTFRVLDESQFFKLQLGEYRGGAGGDSMRDARNSGFSTPDMDNDQSSNGNCAKKYWGGFWYGACGMATLNNPYTYTSYCDFLRGIVWRDWHGWYYSLKAVQMKIRPV